MTKSTTINFCLNFCPCIFDNRVSLASPLSLTLGFARLSSEEVS
jgi:hypothetical protein